MSNITQFTFMSTTWLQQLVGDVDVTKLTPAQAWVPQGNNATPKQPKDSIGYYPGGPAISNSVPNQALWSDSGDVKAQQTSNLLGYHFNVFGSDKAKSFTGPDGNLLFLLGDIRGQTALPYDTIAWSDTADPEAAKQGLILTCWTSINPCISGQPQNKSDNSNAYTLLVFPNKGTSKANPLDLTFTANDMGADNAPHSGVTIPPYTGNPEASTYVVLRFNQLMIKNSTQHIGTGWASVLTNLKIPATIGAADPTTSFTYLRVLSQLDFTLLPTGGVVSGVAPLPAPTTNPCFIQTALHCYDSSYPSYANANLPVPAAGQGYVLVFGSGTFRGPLWVTHPPMEYISSYDRSSIYLSATPYAEFESGTGTVYFQARGTTWSAPSANPLHTQCWPILGGTPTVPTVTGIGDFSVVCLLNKCAQVPELWLMMCDGSGFPGIMLYWSPTPWGPWQPASGVPVFANTNGDGTGPQAVPSGAPFVQDFQKPGNHLNGPVIGSENKTFNPKKDVAPPFKVYGPMVIEKFCKMSASSGAGGTTVVTLAVYWTFCTWIPYYAVLMKSEFTLVVT
jgi:hypothetical protein